MNTKKEELVKEILNKANIKADGVNVFDKLLAERIKLLVERAPMDKLMDATAKIARFELEDFSDALVEYNLKSLPIVDAFIDKHRVFLQKTEGNSLWAAVWLGAFLGKVLVSELNGKWQPVPDSEWIDNFQFGKIKFDNNLMTSPTVTILKSIDDDSYKIEGLVNSLQVLVEDKGLPGFINSKRIRTKI